MSQERDKIARKAFAITDTWWLSRLLSMEVHQAEPLPPRVRQMIEEREADVLLLIRLADGRQFILHLEFQSSNDPLMVNRMVVYDYMLYNTHGLEVIGLVLYTGEKPMSMKSVIRFADTYYRCQMIDIRDLDPELFMQSNHPQLLIHALLAGPDSTDRGLLIRKILNKLRVLLNRSPLELSEAVLEMTILAAGREPLKQLIKKEAQMISQLRNRMYENIRENVLLEDLFAEEHEKGKLEGKLEGKQEGKLEAAARMFQQGLSIDLIQRCTQLERQMLLSIQQQNNASA